MIDSQKSPYPQVPNLLQGTNDYEFPVRDARGRSQIRSQQRETVDFGAGN